MERLPYLGRSLGPTERTPRLLRRLLPLALLLLAARFVGFSVEPAGNQEVDLATGITTLPQGGVLTDNQNGLKLTGKYIQYKEGSFIKAREARLDTGEAEFTASDLEYQVKGETVRLKGMGYHSKDLKSVSAQAGLAFLNDEVVVVRGQVRSADPQLDAELMVVDTGRKQALLIGRFSYQDPKSKAILRGQRAEDMLLLTLRQGSTPLFTSKVPAEVASRLKPYASKL